MVRRKGADKSILHLSVTDHAAAKLSLGLITEEEYKQIIASDKQFNDEATNCGTSKTVTFAPHLTDIPASVSGPSNHTVTREGVIESIEKFKKITNMRNLIIIYKFMNSHPEFNHTPTIV